MRAGKFRLTETIRHLEVYALIRPSGTFSRWEKEKPIC